MSIATFAFVTLTAYLGFALGQGAAGSAPLWLANAGLLAAILRAPKADKAVLYAVGFVGLCVAGFIGNTPVQSIPLAALNIAEVMIASAVIHRFLPGDDTFDTLHGLLIIVLASLLAPILTSLPAGVVLAGTTSIPFATAALTWYAADVMGLLVLAPLLLTVSRADYRALTRPRRMWEAISIALLAGVTTFGVFAQSGQPLLFLILPVLTLAAFRLLFAGTAIVMTIVAAIAVVETLAGSGPIAHNFSTIEGRVLFLQMFLAVAIVATLPVAAILTERRRLMSELRLSEDRFRRLADAAPIAIMRVDANGILTYVNDFWKALVGLTRGAVGTPWLDTLAPETRQAVSSAWASSRQSEMALVVETIQLRADDDVGMTAFALAPEISPAGAAIGWIGVAGDIEQQHKAAERLAASERLYRLLADNSNDMIVRLGLDGVRRYVSPASWSILGFTPEEMIGMTPIAAIHVDDRARVERVCRSLLEGAIDPVCTYRQRRADGSFASLEATYRLIRDAEGRPLEFVASVRDVSRRHAAEREAAEAASRMEESHRLLTMAGAMTGVGHWRLDALTQDLFWSPEVYVIHGRDPADGPPPLDTAVDAYAPQDRDMVNSCIQAGIEAGEPWTFTAQIIRPDGTIRHVEAHGQPERAPDGTIVGLFGVFQDITTRMEAEATLVAARNAAEASAEAKSAFLATMSHEIRTPMTGVLGMIELLRTDPNAADRERFFDSLEQSASLLMTVLDDILDFSKIESRNLILESVDFDLAELARGTLDLFHHAASRKGLLLSLSCPSGALHVRGDPTRLQQVMSNLISNAIKFTHRGKIELKLELSPQGRRRLVRCEVIDTGLGINDTQRALLFEPFVQADASTTRQFGGTGLGLAISRRLIEAMHGTIDVVSTPTEGSTFWFEVTLEEGTRIGAPKRRSSQKPRRPLTVLLAEDNQINQALISALVRRDGHDVVCVANGRQAVDAAAMKRFDVILMDMQMPEMDGLSATRAIRGGSGPCAEVPIIALTADASPERRRFYDGAGLTQFLTKPVDSALLSATLDGASRYGRGQQPSHTEFESRRPVLNEEKLTALETAIGAAQLHSLLGMLAEEARERPAIVMELVEMGNVIAAAAEGHALKGAAWGVGAERLGDAARAIEDMTSIDEGPELARFLVDAAHATLLALDERRKRKACA